MRDESEGSGYKEMIRVFPRKTNISSTDDKAFFGGPPLYDLSRDEEVHVSCLFTWDKPRAESLAEQWAAQGFNVKLGGPAYGDPGGEFIPGRYVGNGAVMTSRGCNNRCWFCYVWKREGKIRELPIVDGNNILDSNLLQCSEGHIRKVFEMLRRQKGPKYFTGGLEARILKDWHVDLLAWVKPKTVFFAYDTEDDYEPLVEAARKMFAAGFTETSHVLSCYCLVGYPGDTFDAAQMRVDRIKALGLRPFVMLYRNDTGETDVAWRKFAKYRIRAHYHYGQKKEETTRLLFA
jgi:hypothetical protein